MARLALAAGAAALLLASVAQAEPRFVATPENWFAEAEKRGEGEVIERASAETRYGAALHGRLNNGRVYAVFLRKCRPVCWWSEIGVNFGPITLSAEELNTLRRDSVPAGLLNRAGPLLVWRMRLPTERPMAPLAVEVAFQMTDQVAKRIEQALRAMGKSL